MIKIFRNIRRVLLSKGRLGRYLLYALGEIILVVIGILIALQINNWNVDRINDKEETIILAALKNEFTENQRQLTEDIERSRMILRLLIELDGYISPNPSDVEDTKLDSMIAGLGWMVLYSPEDGVVNSIISSGKISLLKSNELSSKLGAWKSLMSQYQTIFGWTERDVFELVTPYIKDNFTFKNSLGVYHDIIKEGTDFEYSKSKLLSDMRLENLVAIRTIDVRDLIETSEEILKYQLDVLTLIEKELSK